MANREWRIRHSSTRHSLLATRRPTPPRPTPGCELGAAEVEASAGTACRGADPPQTCLSFSPRDAPELSLRTSAQRGRGECRVPDAPAASYAHIGSEYAYEYSQRSHRKSPGIPARNGFTTYSALSPVTSSFCHRRRRIKALSNPVGLANTSADLTPATGARTTRLRRTHMRRSSCVPDIAHGEQSALRSRSHAQRCRVHRISSRVRDDRDTPLLVGRDGRGYAGDLGKNEMRIFFAMGLDSADHTKSSPSGAVFFARRHRIFSANTAASSLDHGIIKPASVRRAGWSRRRNPPSHDRTDRASPYKLTTRGRRSLKRRVTASPSTRPTNCALCSSWPGLSRPSTPYFPIA
jgi:hypothetical protein